MPNTCSGLTSADESGRIEASNEPQPEIWGLCDICHMQAWLEPYSGECFVCKTERELKMGFGD